MHTKQRILVKDNIMTDFYDIPLTEFDPCEKAVLQPDHEKINVRFPDIAVFAFVGDAVNEYASSHGMKKISEFVSIVKKYPVYLGRSGKNDFILCEAPVGAPAAAQIMDWLIGYGVRKVIAAGSCGVLADIPENTFLLPVKALRDEGTSFHYMEPSRFVDIDEKMRNIIKSVFESRKLHYIECTTWTTDGFFRETEKKVRSRLAEGCICVEMECSALAACAKFRNVPFAQILFTADTLADTSEYDERNWGTDSLLPALSLCADVVKAM